MGTTTHLAALGVSAALLLGACGGDDDATTDERPTEVSTAAATPVPTIAATATVAASPTGEGTAVPPGPGGDYTVVAGDTLGGIASALGVSVEDLAAANDLAEPYVIFPGDVLKVPG